MDDRSDLPEPRVHNSAVLLRCSSTRRPILVVTHRQFVDPLGHCHPGSTRPLARYRGGCRSVAAAHKQLDHWQQPGPRFPRVVPRLVNYRMRSPRRTAVSSLPRKRESRAPFGAWGPGCPLSRDDEIAEIMYADFGNEVLARKLD